MRLTYGSMAMLAVAAAVVALGEAQVRAEGTGHGCGSQGATQVSGRWHLMCSGDDCLEGHTCTERTLVFGPGSWVRRCWCGWKVVLETGEEKWYWEDAPGSQLGIPCVMNIWVLSGVDQLLCTQNDCAGYCWGTPVIGEPDAMCPCDTQ